MRRRARTRKDEQVDWEKSEDDEEVEVDERMVATPSRRTNQDALKKLETPKHQAGTLNQNA